MELLPGSLVPRFEEIRRDPGRSVEWSLRALAAERAADARWLRPYFLVAPWLLLPPAVASLIGPWWPIGVISAALVVVTPAIGFRRALLLEHALVRSAWMGLVCPNCMYEPGSGVIERCPECGVELQRSAALGTVSA